MPIIMNEIVMFKVTRVETTPFEGQKPGTSGLRKKVDLRNKLVLDFLSNIKLDGLFQVKVFIQPHYLQNFVQATFIALGADRVIKVTTLVVSGDCRYYSKDAIQIITKMAAANGVRRVWIGQNGLLSTPAVSAVVRERVGADGSKATGAFILTASHNPGGPHEDFGIKYNMENGGPAPEGQYLTSHLSRRCTLLHNLVSGMHVEDLFDVHSSVNSFSCSEYQLGTNISAHCSYDALHGVAGVHAKRISVEELGANESSLVNCVPKDFGIKYNMENGGPVSEGITNKIYENTTTIKEYLVAEGLPVVRCQYLTSHLSRRCSLLHNLVSAMMHFTVLFGVHAKRISVEELGANESSLVNCVPKDFGIKYNMENGGPAPEGITNKIYENTTTIKEYLVAEGLPVVRCQYLTSHLSRRCSLLHNLVSGMHVEDLFDVHSSVNSFSCSEYQLGTNISAHCSYDALHGVAGVHAKRISVEELGANESSLVNCVPKDFGIKYNMENGGPAPEGITNKIYENTTTIKEYLVAEGLPVVRCQYLTSHLSRRCSLLHNLVSGMHVEDHFDVHSSVNSFSCSEYQLGTNISAHCSYDALHGVAGVHAKRISVEELGANESSLVNCVPKEDFGGGHPDPNLTYAKELVARMGLSETHTEPNPPEFGAAADGDGDRNMVLGKRFFVTPSDSVAIIAANAVQAIPYFSGGLKGVARSMPTSAALDVIAKHLNLKFFEVPTGWEFFGNLMDPGMCSICGEESFGTGWHSGLNSCSDHIREKDGIWAVLAWLSNLVTVEDIVRQHWATYGRHYYTRYDYENVDAGGAKDLMAHLVILQSSIDEVNKETVDVSNVGHADEFEYKDQVDGSVSKHQGIRYLFEDGSRLVFRPSGTGTEGATIRLYIEQYEKDSSKIGKDSQEALAPLVEVALKLSKMHEYTGRSAPTVIT
ncbi:hypothetical protein RND71_023321 [Anisodus tanguticus]|uniref:phosphoglucomutase (alpha-D-glucose-1,6-bisphosphate-dependent) n=1 Tax=Anisodus tanguticus TaxID=243964 RepID=A0AAE1RVD3_9SOLA|nr:hypothetical protein RND71_023321 [Anisodus tanguticus]